MKEMIDAFIASSREGDLQQYYLLIGTELYEYKGINTEEIVLAVSQRIATYRGSIGIRMGNGVKITNGKLAKAEELDASICTLFERRLRSTLANLLEGRADIFNAADFN